MTLSGVRNSCEKLCTSRPRTRSASSAARSCEARIACQTRKASSDAQSAPAMRTSVGATCPYSAAKRGPRAMTRGNSAPPSRMETTFPSAGARAPSASGAAVRTPSRSSGTVLSAHSDATSIQPTTKPRAGPPTASATNRRSRAAESSAVAADGLRVARSIAVRCDVGGQVSGRLAVGPLQDDTIFLHRREAEGAQVGRIRAGSAGHGALRAWAGRALDCAGC